MPSNAAWSSAPCTGCAASGSAVGTHCGTGKAGAHAKTKRSATNMSNIGIRWVKFIIHRDFWRFVKNNLIETAQVRLSIFVTVQGVANRSQE
jgi:hypothetical protein